MTKDKRYEYTEEDIIFMSEVDSALVDRGRKTAYLLSLTVFLLFAAFIVWAYYSVLDEVTRGTGQVIPSQRVQVIQNLEGGILEEIIVQENQIVNKGDILVRLRNEQAQSNYRDAFSRSLEARSAIARLEVEAHSDPVAPEQALPFDKELRESVPKVVQAQRDIYRARRTQINSELNVLQSQLAQKNQEIAEMVNRRKQLSSSLELALEKQSTAKPLMEKKVYPRMDYLAIEQEVLTLRGDIEAINLGIPRVSQAKEEIRRRISQRKAEFRAEVLDELARKHAELKSLEQAISAGADRVTRTDVRSPVKGSVKQIILNTIGGVVKPGEPILEIVPLDDTLLIEAQIRPADIAFLHPGQRALVKITAYDFSIYGGLEGLVEQISVDTIEDERGESFYKVKVRTKNNALMYRGEQLPIIPGMTASVDILTGKKSVLDYLLKPIMKAKQNALRER